QDLLDHPLPKLSLQQPQPHLIRQPTTSQDPPIPAHHRRGHHHRMTKHQRLTRAHRPTTSHHQRRTTTIHPTGHLSDPHRDHPRRHTTRPTQPSRHTHIRHSRVAQPDTGTVRRHPRLPPLRPARPPTPYHEPPHTR